MKLRWRVATLQEGGGLLAEDPGPGWAFLEGLHTYQFLVREVGSSAVSLHDQSRRFSPWRDKVPLFN